MTEYAVLTTVIVGFASIAVGAGPFEPRLSRLWDFLGISDNRSGL